MTTLLFALNHKVKALNYTVEGNLVISGNNIPLFKSLNGTFNFGSISFVLAHPTLKVLCIFSLKFNCVSLKIIELLTIIK